MKKANGAERPVIVTTAHRGVFFGYATDPLLLCAPVGLGVAGLWRWDSHADALPRETAEVVSASCGQVESTDDNAAITPARQSGLDRSGHTQATDEVYFATMKRRHEMRQIVRQGDVLLVPTTARPSKKAQQVSDKGRVILAYGEVTGHAHEVVGVDNSDPVPAMQLFQEPDGRRLLVVNRGAELRHEEHGKIQLAPGGYEVIQQREYTPAAIRNVAD